MTEWVFIFHDEEGSWPRYVLGDETQVRAYARQARGGWVSYYDAMLNEAIMEPVVGRFYVARIVESGEVVEAKGE